MNNSSSASPPNSATVVPGVVSRRALIGAAAIIALGNVLSRLLGLVREQVMAAAFGQTAETDAYAVARTASVILYDLLVGGVITAALVPVFAQFTREERRLWRIAGAIFTLALLVLAGAVALMAAFAEPVVWLLAGGFKDDQRDLGVYLMRVALLSVFFQGLAGVLTSVLYTLNRVALPAFSVAVFNGGVIACTVLLARSLGIRALVLGLVLGALGQFLLQAAGLRAFWRAYRPRVNLRDPAVQRVLAFYAPVAAGMLVTVAGYVIDRNLASRLPPGSLTAMLYATTLIQFPLGIVGLATSQAVLPTLSRFGAGEAESAPEYGAALLFGLKLILLLMLPALAGVVALGQPLVALLFQRGAFTPADTALTAAVLLAYAPQLPLTALDYLLIVAFYARHDTRTPVLVGVATTFLYLAVALGLIRPLGVVGLALADAAKNSAHAAVLLVLLRRTLPQVRLWYELAQLLRRVAPAAVLMGAAVWLAWTHVLSGAGPLLGLPATVALGALLYALTLRLLGVPEVEAVVTLAKARLGL